MCLVLLAGALLVVGLLALLAPQVAGEEPKERDE